MAGKYNRKDHVYERAKREGYRSRAAYKLIELNQKYGLIKRGMDVIDLGAWPGGWLQAARSIVGPVGTVVGIDLVEIEPLEQANVKCITGDVRDEENLAEALKHAPEGFNVLLSDMSPKFSGIKEVDRTAAVGCAELALWAAATLLRSGGTFVVKVFKGNETEEFVRSIRPQFSKVNRIELKSTRKTSNEFYVIGFGYKGAPDSVEEGLEGEGV